jgi:RNA polymerase sigma factor (sigma-70 family)
MTELLSSLDAPSDAELISRVRGGDLDAYGDLFARHVDAARRLARQLTRGAEADDLVSDAFTKVMGTLRNGGGPDVAFRAYLLTAVRRLHVDRIRAQSKLTTSDDMSMFDPGVPFQDTAVEQFESGAAAKAFASLPERWQLVLWHLEVEGQKPADIAPLLGMSANSVSALAYRAREGLRQAFLSAHLAETTEADCRWVTEQLGGYVRKGLSKRDNGKVESHLDGCRSCTAMHLELSEVNSNLGAIIGPLLLGSLAAGYAASGGAGGASGVLLLVDRAKDFVVANLVPVAAGTTAAGVAAVTAVAVAVTGGGAGDRVTADGPVAALTDPTTHAPAGTGAAPPRCLRPRWSCPSRRRPPQSSRPMHRPMPRSMPRPMPRSTCRPTCRPRSRERRPTSRPPSRPPSPPRSCPRSCRRSTSPSGRRLTPGSPKPSSPTTLSWST